MSTSKEYIHRILCSISLSRKKIKENIKKYEEYLIKLFNLLNINPKNDKINIYNEEFQIKFQEAINKFNMGIRKTNQLINIFDLFIKFKNLKDNEYKLFYKGLNKKEKHYEKIKNSTIKNLRNEYETDYDNFIKKI